MAVLVLAGLAYGLLQSMVAPALPVLRHDLHSSQSGVAWIFTAYLLSGSIAMPVIGRLGDIHGKKRTLVVVLSLLAIGTVLSALASSLPLMIAGRAVQGVAGGLFPLAYGIVRDEFAASEDFAKVNELRQARVNARARKTSSFAHDEGSDSDDKVPEARKYLLTGLVRCGECEGPMILSSNPTTRADGGKGYRYYKCRKFASGVCTHRAGFREEVLRDLVIAKLRARLLPAPDDPDSVPSWLTRLSMEIREEIDARTKGQGDPRPALNAELDEIDDQARGWLISLGNPNLSPSTRSTLEDFLDRANNRRHQVVGLLAELEATRDQIDEILDERVVLEQLRRLEIVLAEGNVAEGNQELRRVIDRVTCYADGRVELKTIRLGLFQGATSWFKPAHHQGGPSTNDSTLYWTDPVEFVKPPRAAHRSWVAEHSAEVLAKRKETGWNVRQLSDYFDKCRETIDKALALALAAQASSSSSEN